ncbi:MAG: 8-amino-3,8-dideoxy-manno-octulosonate cytidylyltransferase [Chlamydiia bacterium]|nr:8-amino-3,8-dideoxy-manno-octulosonate cytidylyltransferase [Chlamydiia bacterium]MCH9616220.1 8-amino-3,8-dideoxy-manno-octulosonate cytidylyltransferase [Chlamydiia bacterium]MCH9629794.1 8-amino-3,8-dideoxy-manno-octulosonate cytidylyltransferase [Chlamydiia bacterium]
MKNLLVTGGAGFMGSAFIRVLRKSFAGKLVNFDALTYAADLKRLEGFDVHFEKGDICDSARLEEVVLKHKIDTIVHFAAESHVDRSIDAPEKFLETNVMGTHQLLEIVKKYPDIRFHHISTDEVYGSTKDGLFTEKSPYAPNSPYSASKAASDHLVRAYHKTYGLKVTISHATNNYGPYQYEEKLIPLMIKHAKEGKPLPVYGDGTNVRDWLHCDDHARAVMAILEKGEFGQTYNIGGNNEWTNIDLVRLIVKHVGQGEITFVKDRPGHDFRYALDNSKIRELGWTPIEDFETSLKRLIKPRIVCIIPARLKSTRLPEKVLASIAGKPMLERVYEAAKSCKQFDDVYFAVDAKVTQTLVEGFGAKAFMTPVDCPSGTMRLVSLLDRVDADIYVNWQADEPFIDREMIDHLLQDVNTGDIWTLKTPLEDATDPHVVKVVTNQTHNALYFSREPIPHNGPYFKHVGIYAYTQKALKKIAKLPEAGLQKSESLEQLNFLEHGLTIQVHETTRDTLGIDVADDLALAEQRIT